MFNSERGIGARLNVVKMENWLRGDWYDSTGMSWINPSPNMRNLTEATLYPGLGMIEGTSVSVGRGTDTPFELLGAPWIVPKALAEYLNEREISGVRFVPLSFTPGSSIHAGQQCGGVNVIVTDRDALDAPELGLEIAAALHHLYPDQYKLAAIDGLMRTSPRLTHSRPERIRAALRKTGRTVLRISRHCAQSTFSIDERFERSLYG